VAITLTNNAMSDAVVRQKRCLLLYGPEIAGENVLSCICFLAIYLVWQSKSILVLLQFFFAFDVFFLQFQLFIYFFLFLHFVSNGANVYAYLTGTSHSVCV